MEISLALFPFFLQCHHYLHFSPCSPLSSLSLSQRPLHSSLSLIHMPHHSLCRIASTFRFLYSLSPCMHPMATAHHRLSPSLTCNPHDSPCLYCSSSIFILWVRQIPLCCCPTCGPRYFGEKSKLLISGSFLLLQYHLLATPPPITSDWFLLGPSDWLEQASFSPFLLPAWGETPSLLSIIHCCQIKSALLPVSGMVTSKVGPWNKVRRDQEWLGIRNATCVRETCHFG